MVHGSWIFMGETHELPTSPTGPARHHSRWTQRIAHLKVFRIKLSGFIEYDVDDEPIEEEAEVDGWNTHLCTYDAVCAITSNNVTCCALLRRSGLAEACNRCTGFVVCYSGHGFVTVHGDARCRVHQLCHPGFDRWLVDHV